MTVSRNQRLFEIVTNVVPPVTLIVSLLVYFAWVRRIAYAATLGFDSSVLQEASIPGYLMRGVAPLFAPLVATALVSAAWLFLDRALRNQLRRRRHLRTARTLAWALPTIACSAVPATLLVSAIEPQAAGVIQLLIPFVLAAAVLCIVYRRSLRREIASVTRAGPRSSTVETPSLTPRIIAAALIALFLFAGVDGFAKVVGRGLAREVLDQPDEHTLPVIILSKHDLSLDPNDAVTTQQTAEDGAYRYRYTGLRLLFTDGGSYFLLPRNVTPQLRKLIILPSDGTRIEFVRQVGSVP